MRVNGVSLSSYVFGQGPPVFLLHGLGGTKVSWMPLLEPLGPSAPVIAPDFPGHGDSDKPKADYWRHYYADVVRKLMDTLGTGPAAMIGNSMGGRVALEMAVRYPKRVSALAPLGAAVPGIRWRYLLGFTRIAPTEIAGLPFPMRERWMQYSIRRLFARPERFPESRTWRAPTSSCASTGSAGPASRSGASLQQIVLERPEEFWPRLRRVKAPTLILHGDRDKLVPLRLGNRLAEALPTRSTGCCPTSVTSRSSRRRRRRGRRCWGSWSGSPPEPEGGRRDSRGPKGRAQPPGEQPNPSGGVTLCDGGGAPGPAPRLVRGGAHLQGQLAAVGDRRVGEPRPRERRAVQGPGLHVLAQQRRTRRVHGERAALGKPDPRLGNDGAPRTYTGAPAIAG